MSKFTATKGMSFRGATFRIPNAAFGFELTEFTGGPRKPVRPNIQDIGAADVWLYRCAISKRLLAKVKASGATIVTIGGVPVNPTGNPNSKLREIIVRDPDGFFVELQQPDPLLPAPPRRRHPAIFLAPRCSFPSAIRRRPSPFCATRSDSTHGRRAKLGTNPVVTDLIGLPGAQWRITHGKIPGIHSRLRADRVFRRSARESGGWRRRSWIARIHDGGARHPCRRRSVDEGRRHGGHHGRRTHRARKRRGQRVCPGCQRPDVGVDSERHATGLLTVAPATSASISLRPSRRSEPRLSPGKRTP